MKAIIYQRYGGPEVLELAEVESPKVHVDSVLVRVRAAAVNPADLQMREGLAHANVPTYSRASGPATSSAPRRHTARPRRWSSTTRTGGASR